MARDLSPGLRRALARLIRSRSGVIRDGQRRAILATRSGRPRR